MKLGILSVCGVLLGLAVGTTQAAPILINFSGNASHASYTTDGTNTWQTFVYDLDDNGEIEDIGSTALVDAGNGATGIGFALSTPSGTVDEFGNGGASQAEFAAAKPASGFEWFDESVAEQRATAASNDASPVAYTFTGFNAADPVTFDFVFGRSAGAGNRRIDFGLSSDPDGLLNDAQTAGTGLFVSINVTGATSYTFYAAQSSQNDSPSSIVNAARITVVPEPASVALLGIGGVLVLARRRAR